VGEGPLSRGSPSHDLLSLGRVRHLDTLLEALDAGMPDESIVYVEDHDS
jgi:hypothetical protein